MRLLYFVFFVLFLEEFECFDFGQYKVLTKEFRMIKTWIACPGTTNNQTFVESFRAGKNTVGTFGKNFSDIVQRGKDGMLQSKDLIFCPEEFLLQTGDNSSLTMLNELIESHTKNAVGTSWIVVLTGELIRQIRDSSSVSIRVDQRVFFVDRKTLELSETYSVDDSPEPITNTIGRIDGDSYNFTAEDYFLARRSNLAGTQLQVVIKDNSPTFVIPARLKKGDEGWDETDSGDEIKHILQYRDEFSGIFYDVLTALEKGMNFSSDMFIRRDGRWGFLRDGKWNGVVSTVVKGEADFICASLIHNADRATVLDYLYPVTVDQHGMLIKKDGLEELSWMTYFIPLTNEVWTLLLLNAFFLTLALRLLEWDFWSMTCIQRLSVRSMIGYVGDFWMFGTSYFGRPPTDKGRQDGSAAVSVLFLVVFFVGNIVNMSYRSSLTAELAAKRDSVPFESLEELFQSDYRLIGHRRTRDSFALFTSSDEGYYLNKIYHKYIEPHVGEYIFPDTEAALNELMVTPLRTFMMPLKGLAAYPQFICHLVPVWKAGSSGRSLAFPKDSAFYPFFQFSLMRFAESGGIDVLAKRHYPDADQVCSKKDTREPEDVTLGMKKVIFLFAWLTAGFCLALAVFILESALKRTKNPTEDKMKEGKMSGKMTRRASSEMPMRECEGFEMARKPLSIREIKSGKMRMYGIGLRDKLEEKLGGFLVDWDEKEKKEFLSRVEKELRDAEEANWSKGKRWHI